MSIIKTRIKFETVQIVLITINNTIFEKLAKFEFD